MTDRDDMVADTITATEPLLCPCGAECDTSWGLCYSCDAWTDTLPAVSA